PAAILVDRPAAARDSGTALSRDVWRRGGSGDGSRQSAGGPRCADSGPFPGGVQVKRLLLLAALGMVGCAMPQVSGRLTLPDGTTAQYASKVVEASPMNSVVVTATKVQGGESEVTV